MAAGLSRYTAMARRRALCAKPPVEAVTHGTVRRRGPGPNASGTADGTMAGRFRPADRPAWLHPQQVHAIRRSATGRPHAQVGPVIALVLDPAGRIETITHSASIWSAAAWKTPTAR
jgi:hypothetical protein